MTRRQTKKYKRKKKSPPVLIIGGLLLLAAAIVFIISLAGLSDTRVIEYKEPNKTHNQLSFIDELVPVAKEMENNYGVLPSIILSQAILESDWGTSELGATYNNLFGIKSFSPDDDSVKLETKEFKDGKWITIQANFKVYGSWEDCIRDHTQLFVKGVDWDPYIYQGVLLADDYKTAAKALQVSGYATDPTYATKLIGIIEEYDLDQYDQ